MPLRGNNKRTISTPGPNRCIWYDGFASMAAPHRAGVQHNQGAGLACIIHACHEDLSIIDEQRAQTAGVPVLPQQMPVTTKERYLSRKIQVVLAHDYHTQQPRRSDAHNPKGLHPKYQRPQQYDMSVTSGNHTLFASSCASLHLQELPLKKIIRPEN